MFLNKDKLKSKNNPIFSGQSDVNHVFTLIQEALSDYSPDLYLFGSRARQQEQSTSDIDIAILTGKTLPLYKLSEVRDKIEESKVIYRVDLVDLARVQPEFRQKVLKEGVLWSA